MDAYQDYGSMERKNVKPARNWNASTNKPKELKFSANTNQNTLFLFSAAHHKEGQEQTPPPLHNKKRQVTRDQLEIRYKLPRIQVAGPFIGNS